MKPHNNPARGFKLMAADEPLLSKLKAEWRLALSLHEIRGKSYDSIAHAMHIPVNTVRTHIHKARLKVIALRQAGGGNPVHIS